MCHVMCICIVICLLLSLFSFFFFFNDTATTEIYTLSLHDALPIWPAFARTCRCSARSGRSGPDSRTPPTLRDRKSTRLNSSHQIISYAVFCLKKKKKQQYSKLPTTNQNQKHTHPPPSPPNALTHYI